ncbi:MAG: imidazole glycerol phosphate synthase subunit HisF [Candidatus Diapherotrites archaeon CG10_big_fil_rev_8_21_14_0_10_31_34]|nr:MAG: imidazole glycerol phosphate synthase subunit HisF [Candidatus Diapherotrites archaeon CG10_big_fil_rev_8_21_14_0_10_31_34]
MLSKRIIVCLDCDLAVKGGRVVKGIKFRQTKYAGVPWEMAKQYYEQGADEIVFLDITASAEKRETMIEVVKKTSEQVFVPLTVGGGIKTIKDAEKLFKAGADKVSINSAAINSPELITKISKEFGSQACVVAIDAKKNSFKGRTRFECFVFGGRKNKRLNALYWAKQAEKLGAGEILLTSIDADGTQKGFDLELTSLISDSVNIPVIASGGAGTLESFSEAIKKGKADAVLGASVFHFGKYSVKEVKDYLKKQNIMVRI